MGTRGKVRYVFTSSHTSSGFHTFIPDLTQGIKKLYVLQGSMGTGKSSFIRQLGESVARLGYDVELWISALDPVSPEGLFIPQLDAAVVNGSLPPTGSPLCFGEYAEIINLDDFLDKSAMDSRQGEIMELALRVEKQNNKAYNILKKAAAINGGAGQSDSKPLNMEIIQQVVDRIGSEILNLPVREKHYYASAVTADGVIDYVDELSGDCLKRYILKGLESSVKSAIIKELALMAGKQGHLLEFYHSGLDCEDIIMLIIRDLQIALINAGNMSIIKKPWDIIIDMNIGSDDGVLNRDDSENAEVLRSYAGQMQQAQKLLESAQDSLQNLKKIYSRNVNFKFVNQKREEIRKKLCERQAYD